MRVCRLFGVAALTVLSVLLIDPFCVFDIYSHAVVNFLFFNEGAIIFSGIAVVIDRSMHVYLSIARKMVEDTRFTPTDAALRRMLTRFRRVCARRFAPRCSSLSASCQTPSPVVSWSADRGCACAQPVSERQRVRADLRRHEQLDALDARLLHAVARALNEHRTGRVQRICTRAPASSLACRDADR